MNRPHFTSESQTGTRRRHRWRRGALAFDSPIPVSAIDVTSIIGQLRAQMNRSGQLSEDRLSELRRKVANGDYLTRSVAENCAAQILDENNDIADCR